MVYKPAGTVTGLYREDQDYSPDAAAFHPYSDVYREHEEATIESTPTDDNYTSRIVSKKKGKD